MKTDTQKLKEIIKLMKQYHKEIDRACNNDCEVTLGGNGINSNEAYLTFSAFEKDVSKILEKE